VDKGTSFTFGLPVHPPRREPDLPR
jgi:hypothetical protein